MRPPVALVQVEQPPRGGVGQDLFLRVPRERHAHELGVVAALPQRVDQLSDVRFRAPGHERHLRFTHEDGAHAHSGGVTEVDHVSVEDDVLLAFQPQLAVIATGGERLACQQVLVANDFRPDESA